MAGNLNAQGEYALAEPLYEKAPEIRRRLLTDDHPDTAFSYGKLAANLAAQGNYPQGARPMAECGEEPGQGKAPGRLHGPGTRRGE